MPFVMRSTRALRSVSRPSAPRSPDKESLTMSHPIKEGYIPFKGYQTWYRIVGEKEEPGKLPLLCLHGGPGACHDYLESLDAMADTGRCVIYYDQLGCGNSHLDESK